MSVTYITNVSVPSSSHARSRSSSVMCASLASCAAVLMCSLPRMLPIPREPECNTSHTRSCSSMSTSKKWLPDPSDPICAVAFACSEGSIARENRVPCSAIQRLPSELCPRLPTPTPAGTAFAMRGNSESMESGRRFATMSVRTAAMPQPISTPTAAGMIALRVATTEPTVAPLPMWASGINRTPSTMGRRAVRSAWMSVPGSMSVEPHTLSFSFTTPLWRRSGRNRREFPRQGDHEIVEANRPRLQRAHGRDMIAQGARCIDVVGNAVTNEHMDVARVDAIEFDVESGAPRLVRGLLQAPQQRGPRRIVAHERELVVAQHDVGVARVECVEALDVDADGECRS